MLNNNKPFLLKRR